MDFPFAWPFLIPIIAIISGCATAIFATMAKARVREAEIRERIAMIEKGMVPPPEVDPGAFDRTMSRFDRPDFDARYRSSGRHWRGGVILMAIGFGLMVLIGFTSGELSSGVGVGGFLVILGLAFVIISRLDDAHPRRWPAQPSTTPSESPAHSASDPH
jgi:hypothetical protein